MTYSVRELYINQNRSGEGFNPQGIVVHSTATKGATAISERNYFNNGDRGSSAHAFVDWNEVIYTIPWGEKAWHAMSYANNHFIGVELCEPSGHNVAQFNAVWSNAVELFAQIFLNVLHQKVVTKDNLLSHAEVSARWRETDHTDPVGYFSEYGKTVDNFRADVQSRINAYSQPQVPEKQFSISMIGNVQDVGVVSTNGINSCKIGTEGLSRRLEMFSMTISDVEFNYSVHEEDIGDTQAIGEGQVLGSINMSKRIEGIIINVTKIDPSYKLVYRCHLAEKGWTSFVESGTFCGTKNEGRRVESIEVKVVKK